jgi:hypothetical protein
MCKLTPASVPDVLDMVMVSAGLLTVPDAVTAEVAAPGLEYEPVASKTQVRGGSKMYRAKILTSSRAGAIADSEIVDDAEIGASWAGLSRAVADTITEVGVGTETGNIT